MNTFSKLYDFLLDEEKYESLSNDARMLYAILDSRNQLSKINGLCDKAGNIFVIYQRKDLSKKLHITEKVVAKCMKHLRELGLITEKKQGRGLPNRIYITKIQEPPKQQSKKTLRSKTKKTQDLSSTKAGSMPNQELPKMTVQNSQKTQNRYFQELPKATPIRYIYINKPIYKSKSLSYSHIQTKKDNDIDTIRTTQKKVAKGLHPSATLLTTNKKNRVPAYADYYNTTKKQLQAKINYTKLISENPQDKGILDEILRCMIDVQMSNNSTIKIAKEQKSRNFVMKIFSEINFDDIKFVIEKLKTVRKKIIHVAAYIKTVLYNCKMEMQTSIQNQKTITQTHPQKEYYVMPITQNKFANFSQHDYDWDKIEQILAMD